ncbi:hypothetical protein B9Z55_000667 [Caenorhabditis nigoni]|uniref:F-box associated domain-containing protein n=1 Tax=Caenorhabditis nigoni TaxID=1611254 RepID=A0A2G5VUJ0_9PELO|nr:hypothetical protein B9Z55_000667 [Caenorhabditis nigoni]
MQLPPPSIFSFQSEEIFHPESKFYQAESIGITQAEIFTPAVLRNFQGRQAFIKSERCKGSDVIEFINSWKSAEVFWNLEYLKIETTDYQFSRDQILNAIGTKYIDGTKTPPTHTLPQIYIEYPDAEPFTEPITSYAYVVRESDNWVASVEILGKKFSFGVWNKTENEFLGMMD